VVYECEVVSCRIYVNSSSSSSSTTGTVNQRWSMYSSRGTGDATNNMKCFVQSSQSRLTRIMSTFD
jgi:hypothetical protein